jgi:hypothetical protein
MPPMMIDAFGDAMSYIFMGSLFIIAVAFIAILFIPQITLRGRGPQTAVEKAEKVVEDVAPGAPVTSDVSVVGSKAGG